MKSKTYLFGTLALVVVVTLTGCASGGGGGGAKGPSDEELIQGMIIDVLAALQNKDVDTMVSFYAEDFTSDNGGKEETKAFLQGAADQGFLDGIEVDTESMEIMVEGETAKVGPVGLEGAFGALSLSFDLEKRDGSWLVVGQQQSM